MSHCHSNPATSFNPSHKNKKSIVLTGNPNVGKSVFFNAFTGLYVDVSNFPGTTVDISYGQFGDYVVIDTPGVYGVSSFNDEERVARDVILEGDLIVNVVDAVHLERDLFLTQQLIDTGKPVIIALNMMDDVKRNGLSIDVPKLSRLLGVPIIPTIAPKKIGFEELKNSLETARPGHGLADLAEPLKELAPQLPNPSEALLILEDDEHVKERNQLADFPGYREKIYQLRRERVNQIVEEVVSETQQGASFKTKLSRWMLRPITGFPILFVTLALMYLFLGFLVAQTIVDFTEGVIMEGYYQEFILRILSPLFQEGSFWFKFFIGDFGLLTMVPVYILGLLLPLVIGFYLLLSILEDSGYLPRIAALVDKGMMKIGLNGRAIIPMILGFGCVTMATMTTRILGSKRERFIATMLLGLAIPCSAQLGVITGMMAGLGLGYFVLYFIIIFLVFGIVGVLLNRFLPGKSTDLLIDIPPLRIPQAKNVFAKMYAKSVMFLKEATPLFILGSVLITLMEHFHILDIIQQAAAPLTEVWLKLPRESATAFIMGIIRRDFGAAGLFDLANQGLLNPGQILVSLVVITLFVPCIAAILIIFKERSWKESFAIWVGSFIIAFAVGGVLAQVLI